MIDLFDIGPFCFRLLFVCERPSFIIPWPMKFGSFGKAIKDMEVSLFSKL